GSPSPSTQESATSRPPPLAYRAETTPQSAHSTTPYAAFSTLHPVTTRPSSTRPAAPTGNFEYGAYARPITSVAAARSAGQSMSNAPSTLHVRLAIRCRRAYPADQAGNRDDGRDVGQHVEELTRHRAAGGGQVGGELVGEAE